MKDYEILFIIQPTLSSDNITKTCELFQSWIKKTGGSIFLFQEIGFRPLATEFKKFNKGYYVQAQFSGSNETLALLNKNLRVASDSSILRYIIIDLESIYATKEDRNNIVLSSQDKHHSGDRY